MRKKTTIKKIFVTLLCIFFFNIHAQNNLELDNPGLDNPELIKEKKITVIIPSYNNKDWYKRNLQSVYSQKYDNYTVIYINDNSTDDTGKLVEEYVTKINQNHRTTIINNKKNIGGIGNIYKAVHSCDDDTIVVTTDGDDWLKDDTVLQKINNVYQNPNIWMTYGQYETIYHNRQQNKYCIQAGHCCHISPYIVNTNAYREDRWNASHLRTFYAGLFKQIKLKDFLHNSKFYHVAWDMAFMIPMLEMAKGKYKFIEDVLYVYNCITPFNDHKLKRHEQLHFDYTIRAKEKYQPVTTAYSLAKKIQNNQTADLVIMSENNPQYLYAMIKSIYKNTNAINKIYILKDPCYGQYRDLYNQIKDHYPEVTFIKVNPANFKDTIESILKTTNNNHVLLAKSNIICKDYIDISKCIKLLDTSYAYGFYLSLGENIIENDNLLETQDMPINTELEDGVFFWQFKCGNQVWRNPNNLLMTLYKKHEILQAIEPLYYTDPSSLLNGWRLQSFDFDNVGLFDKESKVFTVDTKN